jgi:hypothetical protein
MEKLADPGILMGQNKYIHMLLFADALMIIQNNGNKLQRSVFCAIRYLKLII